MKKMILAVALAFIGSSAFAGSIADMSWDQIAANPNFTIEWPNYGFDGATVPANNVCVDGDQFKTINPVSVCTQSGVKNFDCYTRGSGDTAEDVCVELAPGQQPRGNLVQQPACTQYGAQVLAMSRSHSVTECSQYDAHGNGDSSSGACAQYSTHTQMDSANLMVDIVTRHEAGGDVGTVTTVVARKAYTIPACAK